MRVRGPLVLAALLSLAGCGASGPAADAGSDPGLMTVRHDLALNDVVVTVDSDYFGDDWMFFVLTPTWIPTGELLEMYLFRNDCSTLPRWAPHVSMAGSFSFHDINQASNLAVVYVQHAECFETLLWTRAACDHRVDGDLRVSGGDDFHIRFDDVVFTCHEEGVVLEGPMIRSIRLDGVYSAPLEPWEP